MRRSGAGVVVGLGLLLGVTSCGGGTNRSDSTGEAAETVLDVRDPQGSVDGYEGALEDTALSVCGLEDGRFRAEGELTNPTGESRAYRIYVSVMDGDDTRAIVQVDVPAIEPGASRGWGTDVDLDADGHDCWLRVERFAPGDG